MKNKKIDKEEEEEDDIYKNLEEHFEITLKGKDSQLKVYLDLNMNSLEHYNDYLAAIA